ncbi:MAG: HAMP domain-containing protein [Kiritimatiellae bacterium]|nr:HAMP domain-containing protein [Kiritimatiellia bacterium]
MISIRWKIILLCLVTVVLPVAFLNRYMIGFFDAFTRRNLEEHMIDNAFLIGQEYKAALEEGGRLTGPRLDQLQTLLSEYSAEVDARIQLLSETGVVVLDSEPGGEVGRDLSHLPEVDKALTGVYKARCALTPDRKYMFYYTALPIKREGRLIGVAYLHRHTSPIIRAINAMVRHQRITTGVAVALAALVAFFLGHTMTRRLRRLTAATTRFAKGEAPMPVQVRGRDEIAELGAAVNQMADELYRRNQYNREFISTVTHELKMPLTAIKGAAELLDQGAVENEKARTKFLSNIRYEVDRMIRMVWELGELTKLDVETLRGQKEKTDYGAFVGEVLDRLMPTFDQAHARLVPAIPEETFTTLIVRGRIEQVISNLLENAFRYTPVSGDVHLVVERGEGKTVRTSVRDSGPGIPEANIEKIWDRFFTTEPKDVPKDYGSGLGLSIAKTIVQNHQGRIWVESRPGEGACFSFTLPLA